MRQNCPDSGHLHLSVVSFRGGKFEKIIMYLRDVNSKGDRVRKKGLAITH